MTGAVRLLRARSPAPVRSGPRRRRTRGAGLTEYLIVIGLVVLAAVTVYYFFNDILRG